MPALAPAAAAIYWLPQRVDRRSPLNPRAIDAAPVLHRCEVR